MKNRAWILSVITWVCFIALGLAIVFLVPSARKQIGPVMGDETRPERTDTTKKADVGYVDKPDPEILFDKIDKAEIFKRLFDNPVIDSNNEALWTPNYYERRNLPVSYDKKVHTGIDTIMYFTDKDKAKNAVVLFGTYHYCSKGQMDGAHSEGAPIGIALFSQNKDGKWELYKFERGFTTLGLYGGADPKWRGNFSLMEIGDKWTCLCLSQENCSNGGYQSHTEWLYSIEQYMIGGFPNTTLLNNILTFDNYYDNTGSYDRKKQDLKTKMNIVKKKGTYYSIDLVTTGKGGAGIKHYEFSEENNCFVRRK
ncbi:MAG TPA: hypothetical protein VN922_11425 [Bacteroidia bacterium]|nr:hypothetical protein [Bacteroidia bacterium]